MGLVLAVLHAVVTAQCPTEKIKGPSSFSGDKFGRALSRSGKELLVGAWLTASVFVLDDKGTPLNAMDDTWTHQGTLVTPDPSFSDNFGESVCIDANHLVVGAPTAGDSFGFGPGAAHVYRRIENGPSPFDDSWLEQATLAPANSTVPLGFGSSVGLSGDYAAIGAVNDQLVSQGSAFGTVHVYRREDNGTPDDRADDAWLEQAIVVSADSSYGSFGEVVRIVDNYLIVSAPSVGTGAVYCFWRDDNGTPADPTDDAWVEQSKVTPPFVDGVSKFGRALDFNGSLMAVGAFGRAFLFRLNDNGTPLDIADDFWTDEATLLTEEVPSVAYGSAVAVHGDLALVGDPSKLVTVSQIGVTHVFRNDMARWKEIERLASPSPPANKFGSALRLEVGRAFIGEIGNFAFLTADDPQDLEVGAVWPYVMATLPWSFQDAALPGTGTPCLIGSGSLTADSQTAVSLDHELANAPTALVVGLAAINAPFKGGVLVPQPSSVLWTATDITGDIALSGRWPKGVATGTNLFLQAWTVDSQGPSGFSATNGMHGVTP